jgi:predicted nucleotidyltransferase
MNEANKRFEFYKKILLEIIHRQLPTCKVYLFGSRARGTHQPGADIDLALDMGKPIDFNIIASLLGEIEESNVPLMVDLVDLYTASDAFKKEVNREGIEWKI